jgi:hypothetical protein
VNVIGADGVPERVIVTVPEYRAPSMYTVWPAFTTLAAAWMVQNGVACVPGPELLHDPEPPSTYSADAVASADAALAPARAVPALAVGMAGVPASRNDVAAPASQAKPRMPHVPTQIPNFSCYYIPVSHPKPQEIELIEARQRA